jgi:hypothetical protein
VTILHKQLALADVVPDMVLSDDLLDPQGQILLPKGATLTQHAIDSMHRHNVVSVPVVMGEMTAAEEAAKRDHAEERLARLFRNSNKAEANGLLYRYVRAFRLGDRQ